MRYPVLILTLSLLCCLTSVKIYAQIPVQNLEVWLNSDSGVVLSGSLVSQWNSCNGVSTVASQSNPIYQPAFISSVSALNNKPVLEFNTSFINIPDSVVLGTFFITCNNSISSFSDYDGLLTEMSSSFFLVGQAGTTSFYPSVAASNMFINGQIQSYNLNPMGSFKLLRVKLSSPVSSPNLSIGVDRGNIARCWKGYIGDVIIYSSLLNQSEINQVETYLMDKYAPPVNIGNDATINHSFCPFKIKAGSIYKSVLWSTGSTADSIVVNKTGNYWVEVVDIFGRTSRDTIHVQYPYTPLPNKNFCIGDTLKVNTGLNNAYSFLWSDGSSDSLLHVTAPGTYWVEITDSTAAHCSLRDTFVVVADSFAVQASLGPDLSLCAGNTIELVSGAASGLQYEWSTGDTTEAITVHASGEYSLTATNNRGCVARDTVYVNIIGVKPTVAFNSNIPCKGDAAIFTDVSYSVAPDGIAAWNWDFAGQGVSDEQNPQFIFDSNGDYNVKLVVTTDSGCVGDTAIAIHVRSLPKAYFNPANACSGQPVSFHNQTSLGEGALFSWGWDFGDGNTSDNQDPTHAFTDTGVYVVKLVSSDIYGCSDTVFREVNVRLSPNVDFLVTENCAGLPVNFVETTDMPVWASIISRKWSFGDNTFSTIKSPSHVYSNYGNYDVTLINTSINGCTDSATKVIQVYPYPVAGFTNGVACEGSELCFTDTSYIIGGNISAWKWNFGNGMVDSVQSPCVFYEDSGVYYVVLNVVSDFGCSSTVNKGIIVYPKPHSQFSLQPEYGIPPLDVQFYNHSQGAVSYHWLFGDGAFSDLVNPSHTYNSENIFEINLISENTYGCTDTARANVYVIPSTLDLVLTNLVVNDSSGFINLKAQFFNNGTRVVRKIALDARVGNSIPVREEWSGVLGPGDFGEYTFISSFLKPDIDNIRLVCLDISALDSYGQQDIEPENNATCNSLINEFFIASVFPSPASDYVYADISVPDEGNVYISVLSREGKELKKEIIENVEAGTLRIKMDLRSLSEGLYLIRAIFEDKSDIYRFVKVKE